MTRTIGEGKKVVEAMERYHRVFRINTWFRFQANFLRLWVSWRGIFVRWSKAGYWAGHCA